jgi:hypothetical protein
MGRYVNRSDELDPPLQLRRDAQKFFMQKAMRQQHLSRPLNQLGARGVHVTAPPPRSRGAVVKVWTGKVTTSGTFSRYLEKGKGIDGTDAELFGPEGAPVDRLSFASQAKDDSHEFRLILSALPHPLLDWVMVTRAFMEQLSRDVRSRLQWQAAVHEDTPYRHVHLQVRAQTDHQQPLYFTKHYWMHGLRYRLQSILTAYLGRVRPGHEALERRALQAVGAGVLDTWDREPLRPRVLTPTEVQDRMAETQATIRAMQARLARRREPHHGRVSPSGNSVGAPAKPTRTEGMSPHAGAPTEPANPASLRTPHFSTDGVSWGRWGVLMDHGRRSRDGLGKSRRSLGTTVSTGGSTMARDEAARHPRAFEGEERTETHEQTQTVAQTVEDRAQALIARLDALGRERSQAQDRSRGVE